MKYIKGTFILFVVSVLFVASTAKADVGYKGYDNVTLKALSVATEMATKTKTTTKLQYHNNIATFVDADDHFSIKVLLRKGDVGTTYLTVAEGATSTWSSSTDRSKIQQTGSYIMYGQNATSKLRKAYHTGIWYYDRDL